MPIGPKGIESLALKFFNPYIFATGWCKPLIFQTLMFLSNRNLPLKYLRSISLGCKDIGIRKQSSCQSLNSFEASSLNVRRKFSVRRDCFN